MESVGPFEIALIVVSSVAAAGLIMGIGVALPHLKRLNQPRVPRNLNPTFLFDGEVLCDVSLDAQEMIKDVAKNLTEKQAVISLFQDRFPTLDYVISHLGTGDIENLSAADDSDMSLRVEDANGMTRITLFGARDTDNRALSESAAHESMIRELQFLRDLVDASPHMMWAQDATGKLTWANTAYMKVSDQLNQGQDPAKIQWPSKPMFPDLHLDAKDDVCASRRVSLSFPEASKDAWFEVATIKSQKDVMHFAYDANATVAAEDSKVKAMQTSGLLFGSLATGLAIFDHNRRLSMFNPALTDLTRLKPAFLAARPTLDMFLDALREARILPEPKNYGSWREQFTALETAARAGTYNENWETIDGQTFRVAGKPYADKSFVFMFDDISAGVALTQSFKTDIETGQGVIDSLPDAIAVFAMNGTLLLSNQPYRDMWGSDHAGSMHTHQLRGEIGVWQDRSMESPSWGNLRNYIASPEKPAKWVDHIILNDGRHVTCEAKGINKRSTMITFRNESKRPQQPLIHKLTMQDPAIQEAKR